MVPRCFGCSAVLAERNRRRGGTERSRPRRGGGRHSDFERRLRTRTIRKRRFSDETGSGAGNGSSRRISLVNGLPPLSFHRSPPGHPQPIRMPAGADPPTKPDDSPQEHPICGVPKKITSYESIGQESTIKIKRQGFFSLILFHGYRGSMASADAIIRFRVVASMQRHLSFVRTVIGKMFYSEISRGKRCRQATMTGKSKRHRAASSE